MVAVGRRGLSDPVDVLVVGAGPSGLGAALQAHCHGATVRVVERRSEAFRPSRAMIMHPRTLECLRPLGVTDELLDRARALQDQPERMRLYHEFDRVWVRERAELIRKALGTGGEPPPVLDLQAAE